jgi:hemolysin activation/secretion protein
MNHRFARLLAGSILATAVASAWAQEAVPEAIRFEISRFEVTGNTLLSNDKAQQAVAPFTGKDRDFGSVQQALEALENAYRDLGYSVVSVELPEQELDRGVVQLKVVETKIGHVNVKNNKYFDEANVRRALPGLQPGQTPNLRDVSASLKLSNENPAKRVALKLAGGEKDDEVDANLEVTDDTPWKVMANADNTGTSSTGKTHLGFVLQHANLFGRDHVASLQYSTTAEKPGAIKVYGLGYHIPLYALGDSLDFFASYSNVDSGTVTAGIFDLAISGKGAVYGGRYTHNLRKQGDYEHKLVYGVDYKAFKNSILVLGTNLGNNVTVHPLSVTYQGSLGSATGELGGSVSLVRNVPGGSGGKQADFNLARAGAKDDYTLLRLGGSYSRVLADDWQVRAIVNAQYTSDALIPGEQYGGGGASSVRGFGEREISNDSGIGGNLELYTPNLCGKGLWQCRALAFYDTAYVKRNHALPGELTSTSIASTGVGLRLMASNYVNLQLDYGHVARAGATQREGGKLHLRLGLSY